MNFFSTLRKSNIRFNPKPWFNSTEVVSKKIEDSKDNLVHLHTTISQKVDELINQLENEGKRFETWEQMKLSTENQDSDEKSILKKHSDNITDR